MARDEIVRNGHPRQASAPGRHVMGEARVIRPGLLTTIQDLGRWGFQAQGVSVAGPMDLYSHRVANALVGNRADAATLEVTLLGPELEFDDTRVIAVAGAEFELALGGRRVSSNATWTANAGSRLTFGRRLRGTRAYVAVEGGFDLPPVLGSRATHVTTAIGGLEGRALKTGDRVPLGQKTSNVGVARVRTVPASQLPDHHTVVRVLAGPQHEEFDADALDTLVAAPYTLAQRSDRMGFRLDGAPLTHTRDASFISDATPMGAIQVPASGMPILLMADRQTTGGYPKIANVISADLKLAGQLGPGDTISFVRCSPREALAALIAQERALMTIEHEAT
jgi:antagonist of KipI